MFKKKREERDAPQEDLSVEVCFIIKNKAIGYGDCKTRVKVKSEHSLNSSSDTPIKELKAELETIIENAINDLDDKITNCKYMTDGHWLREAEKSKEED